MMLVNEEAEKYVSRFTSPHNALLQEILDKTFETHAHARMISGDVQGKFLQMISAMLRPLKVLEIGTFTGFSALCLAAGMANGGELHTIELREEDAATAQHYFDRSDFSHSIKLHTGDAKKIIPALMDLWDLVFIDADKMSYIDYYELTLPRVRTGGFIMADNVLFHGQVLEDNISGKNAKAIHAFNEYTANDHRTEQVMLTVRDGISLLRKL